MTEETEKEEEKGFPWGAVIFYLFLSVCAVTCGWSPNCDNTRKAVVEDCK